MTARPTAEATASKLRFSMLPSMRLGYLLHRLDYVHCVLVSHGRVDWQGDGTLVDPFRVGKVPRPVPEGTLVVGVQVKGDEVDAGADVEVLQRLDEPGPVDIQHLQVEQDRVEVPGMLNTLGHDGTPDLLKAGEGIGVQLGDRVSPFPEGVRVLNPNPPKDGLGDSP